MNPAFVLFFLSLPFNEYRFHTFNSLWYFVSHKVPGGMRPLSIDDAFRESSLYSRTTRDELPLSTGDMDGASDTDSGSRAHRAYSSRLSEEKKSRLGLSALLVGHAQGYSPLYLYGFEVGKLAKDNAFKACTVGDVYCISYMLITMT